MSTPDAQNSSHAQTPASTNVPRRPRMTTPGPPTVPTSPVSVPPTPLTSPMPATPFDTPISSLDTKGVFSATASTPEPAAYPTSSPTLSSHLSSMPAASTAVPESAPEVDMSATSPLRVAKRTSLPAHPVQVVRPPSLKLPSIAPTPPGTSLPQKPSLPDDGDFEENMPYEHAIDFATQSWDLATGGLKTMTAKRELPTRLDRKSLELPNDESLDRTTRNYTFALIIMVCIILMLIGSGVVIFVLLQQ